MITSELTIEAVAGKETKAVLVCVYAAGLNVMFHVSAEQAEELATALQAAAKAARAMRVAA